MPMGCTDAQLAGLRQWASTRTWDDIHIQIEGYLGRYPSLCPDSNNLGSYEEYARGYSKENQPNPLDDCTVAVNLCRKDSKCYVGDEAANAPGGCYKPGGVYGTCEERGDCPTVIPPAKPPGACPKGEQFLASGWELIAGCPDGYTRPQFGDYCVCDTSAQGKGTGEYGADNSLQGIIKMLPQLLMVMVIVSIIGAFRK